MGVFQVIVSPAQALLLSGRLQRDGLTVRVPQVTPAAKLELATKRFNDAAVTSRAFLEAYPDNPLALGHAAVAAALLDNMQEAANLFDRSRELTGAEVPDDLVRIAMTLVQVAAQVGQFGLAESTIEWLVEKSLGSEEERIF